MKQLGTMAPEARRSFGAAVNVVKDRVGAALETRKAELEAAALAGKLATDRVDSPSPSAQTPPPRATSLHQPRLGRADGDFRRYGLFGREGPDIETDDYNFTRLNVRLGVPRGSPTTRSARAEK